ncbi:DNA double-strand break repair ATPase Rad50 [Halovivax limisalsi]|uniref:DNA double-strand break repair ATPase Rad50 n=1 Tax=Halovivax limisalsi TaxID=1453760 RepID=UPI001FFD9577|nr:DNA double-strand break repair ATPase Rad50 [Halovivax limisalsi]
MRVERLSLTNFKCYGEVDLSLSTGVTVVHGVNGSGKSTLLEAVFFALYGSKALDDRALADVITTGEDGASVTLWFRHAGAEYRIERRLSRRDDRAVTTKCVLEGPEGTVDGARDVRAFVTDLLRMDATAFVNCAYVRQGEVNKLIHASPGERQDMIDDLLQLGALESYRERASEARLGVSDVLDEVRGEAATLDEQIEAKEEKSLHDRLNGLETKRSDVVTEIERFEEQRENAIETRDSAQDVLDTHEEIREELEDLDERIETLREKITETESDREEAAERLSDLRSRREDVSDRIESLRSALEGDLPDEDAIEARLAELDDREESLRSSLEDTRVEITERTGTIESLRETAAELEEEAETSRSDAESLAETLAADRETIEERSEKLAELDEDIEDARARFEDAPVDPSSVDDHLSTVRERESERREELTELTTELATVESAIEEAEELLEAGKCPECGQPVEDSPHVNDLAEERERRETLAAERDELEAELETLAERIERAESLAETARRIDRLEDQRESLSQLLEEKRETVEDKVQQRESLIDSAEDAEATATENRERAASIEDEIETLREELGEYNERLAALRETREQVETLRSERATRAEIDREIETVRERRADWKTMNEERRAQLSDARDRRSELEAEFDDDRVEAARENLADARSYIERVDEKLDELRGERDDLQNAIGAVENELEELESLRERREAVADRMEALESLHADARTLQDTYETLRAELRQRNVETLERLLNETFELVYQNDSYAGIDLDGSYQLTVYQKDGEALDPEQLSGGERALFNLSLRCAIYRLLAEGVDGAAPLPPLILDEPTVFLDAGHVGQLVSLVESMRELGVEQIVLVSHDEELVGAADDLVHVEKDATTNRSTLAHRDALDLVDGLPAAGRAGSGD